jgi:two-component system sensor histidine kinase KdpD
VATWAYEHDQPAGRGTDTLPAAPLRCHPLKTSRGVVGVLGIRPIESAGLLSPEQRQMLVAFASQAALAIERVELAETARRADVLQAAEKLQTALLNSISHDLRTPLVSITGALSSLDDERPRLTDPEQRNLIQAARAEADRLNRLVGNLLNMTRLEAGGIRVHLEPCDVQDVIGAALEQLGERLEGRPVNVDVPEDLPLVPLDFGLIVQAMVNVLDNAVKYSPPGQPIEVWARIAHYQLQISVADRGIGIPPEDLERVFDKFYRVQRPHNVSGTGLGLAICKGIVQAHRGAIQAINRPGGGTNIRITLPLEAPA